MPFRTKIKNFEKWFGFKNEINWLDSFFVVGYHVLGFYWCWHFAFPVKIFTVLFAFFMFWLSGFAITCGVHRYFTHRSYKVKTPLKILLVLCFCATGQYSIYNWVRDHRLHHKCSDTDGDPHNASRGFFFSHIGWLMVKRNEEAAREAKKIDMNDILSDNIIMWQERYYTQLELLCCYVLPLSFNVYLLNEEWKCAVAWQCFIRYLSVLHCEFSVNSFAHIYGYQPYNKNIIAKENKFVSIITFGEGWHNYHHVFPFDFKAAEYFDYFNWSTAIIRWWAKMGWAYDLKEASPEMIRSVMKTVGDEVSSDKTL